MIHFVVPAGRENLIHEYLAFWGRNLSERMRILHYETLVRQTRCDRGTYVLSTLDELSPAMERAIEDLHRQLDGMDGVRILNHPIRTLRRYDLLAELRRLDLNEFRAVRASEDFTGLRYPVFIRAERSHDGAISPLLHSATAVEAGIGRALVQGHRLRDLLVVEFCETSDEAGFYRKYAAFIVGNRVVARSLNYGREWMLKFHGTEYSRSMVLEEREYVLSNPHDAQLAEIFRVGRVEYGRIDYSIKNGRVQTWEINLNPTIGRGLRPSTSKVPTELDPIRRETKDCFYSRFQKAWAAVDLAPDGEPAVPVTSDPRRIRAALSIEGRRGRLLATLRTVLRPVKPLIEPRAAPALRLLSRLARGRFPRPDSRGLPFPPH
jgi:hypothetical protein